MPLTSKGSKILSNMKSQYGSKKGTSVFYASQNKGTITGTHKRGTGGAGASPCKIMKREGGMKDE